MSTLPSSTPQQLAGGLQATEVENLTVEIGKIKNLGTPNNYISADTILSLIMDYAHQQHISPEQVLEYLHTRIEGPQGQTSNRNKTLLQALPFLKKTNKPA